MISDNLSGQPIEQKTAIIYQYLAQLAENLEPESVTNEVRCLFLQGKIEIPEIVKALEDIVNSKISERDFGKFINCAFHTIINVWLTQPEAQEYIPFLITVFEEINPKFKSYDRNKAKLTKLVVQYRVSEAYFRLRSLIDIVNYDGVKNLDTKAQVVSLVQRYIYLYKYYFLEDDYVNASKTLIAKIQTRNQQIFEFKLSKYIIYQVRLLQLARMRLLSKGSGKVINRVKNPTLLSDRDFKVAIKHYLGKIDGKNTLLQLSHRLSDRNKAGYSYKVFKQELQQYLVNQLKTKNQNYHFDRQLDRKISSIFPKSDDRPLNNSLILQTCRQLLSFIVIETKKSPNYQQFANLAANLGTAQAVLLLVKILLICPEVKPDLEKKLIILFNYYQEHEINEVLWLVKTLEYLEISYSIYFGKIDVSIARGVI